MLEIMKVTVIYNGNAKYNATNITKTFSIGKISDYNITLNNTEIIAGENSPLVIFYLKMQLVLSMLLLEKIHTK